jgi:GT2 family glycosyltransferase
MKMTVGYLNIDVIIPVLNEAEYTDSLLRDISENSIIPDRIIVINNGSTDATGAVVENYKSILPVEIINNETNIGVNASWNLGIKMATADLVSILNNDIVINKFFFEVISQTFDQYKNCGMACPRTYNKSIDEEDPSKYIEIIKNHNEKELRGVAPVPWRYGWAFTVKRDLALQMLVPEELFNYCGDDYHFLMMKKLGYDILQMENNIIFHHGAITGKTTGLRHKMHEDTNKWNEIKKDLGW